MRLSEFFGLCHSAGLMVNAATFLAEGVPSGFLADGTPYPVTPGVLEFDAIEEAVVPGHLPDVVVPTLVRAVAPDAADLADPQTLVGHNADVANAALRAIARLSPLVLTLSGRHSPVTLTGGPNDPLWVSEDDDRAVTVRLDPARPVCPTAHTEATCI